ncbi:MAG: hypothetical protein P8P99_12815 [Maricaulis sp.]|nr:hypothetical protein [Maricaulis sp.]
MRRVVLAFMAVVLVLGTGIWRPYRHDWLHPDYHWIQAEVAAAQDGPIFYQVDWEQLSKPGWWQVCGFGGVDTRSLPSDLDQAELSAQQKFRMAYQGNIFAPWPARPNETLIVAFYDEGVVDLILLPTGSSMGLGDMVMCVVSPSQSDG